MYTWLGATKWLFVRSKPADRVFYAIVVHTAGVLHFDVTRIGSCSKRLLSWFRRSNAKGECMQYACFQRKIWTAHTYAGTFWNQCTPQLRVIKLVSLSQTRRLFTVRRIKKMMNSDVCSDRVSSEDSRATLIEFNVRWFDFERDRRSAVRFATRWYLISFHDLLTGSYVTTVQNARFFPSFRLTSISRARFSSHLCDIPVPFYAKRKRYHLMKFHRSMTRTRRILNAISCLAVPSTW